jgi:hypothetical protein
MGTEGKGGREGRGQMRGENREEREVRRVLSPCEVTATLPRIPLEASVKKI